MPILLCGRMQFTTYYLMSQLYFALRKLQILIASGIFNSTKAAFKAYRCPTAYGGAVRQQMIIYITKYLINMDLKPLKVVIAGKQRALIQALPFAGACFYSIQRYSL